jgi:citrate lyase subunit beta / citryl-CoA lyase
MDVRPRRSVLYMPGSNRRALEKARGLAADGLIFDLEDAVAPDAKEAARAEVAAALKGGGYDGRETIVRVNGLDSAWGREDLAAAVAAAPDAILIPKASDPRTISEAAEAMEAAGAPQRIRLWAMIETPRAILEVGAIARMAGEPSSRLAVLVMGTNDLAKETRARQIPGRAIMLPWLATTLVAARAYGLDILDGVYGDFSDPEGLRAECQQGRDLGMDGKTLIHPSQIDICNAAFSPAAEDVAEARAIVDAFDRPENAGRGAISLEGRMVERLHAAAARRLLALAAAVEARRR